MVRISTETKFLQQKGLWLNGKKELFGEMKTVGTVWKNPHSSYLPNTVGETDIIADVPWNVEKANLTCLEKNKFQKKSSAFSCWRDRGQPVKWVKATPEHTGVRMGGGGEQGVGWGYQQFRNTECQVRPGKSGNKAEMRGGAGSGAPGWEAMR